MKNPRWPTRILLLPLALVAIFSIHALDGFLPPCAVHELTDWHCPGCGATRATKALAAFRLDEAFRQNALFTTLAVVGLPIAFLAAARERFPGNPWLRPFRWRANFLWLVLVTLVAFTILRNVPHFRFLAPQ